MTSVDCLSNCSILQCCISRRCGTLLLPMITFTRHTLWMRHACFITFHDIYSSSTITCFYAAPFCTGWQHQKDQAHHHLQANRNVAGCDRIGLCTAKNPDAQSKSNRGPGVLLKILKYWSIGIIWDKHPQSKPTDLQRWKKYQILETTTKISSPS